MSALVLLTACSFENKTLGQTVIRVSDGDSLILVDSQGKQTRVRLGEIDAPEKGQAFGNRAKRSLADICLGKIVEINRQDVDQYGRVVARVRCNGVDANAEMVRMGYAWVYDKYAKDQSLYDLQSSAREQRIGLWQQSGAIPPWEFRKSRRQ